MFQPDLTAQQINLLNLLKQSRKPIPRATLLKKVYGKVSKETLVHFQTDLSCVRRSSHLLAKNILCFKGINQKNRKRFTKYGIVMPGSRVSLLP